MIYTLLSAFCSSIYSLEAQDISHLFVSPACAVPHKARLSDIGT